MVNPLAVHFSLPKMSSITLFSKLAKRVITRCRLRLPQSPITNKGFYPKPQPHGVGVVRLMNSAEQNVFMNRVCVIKGHSNQGTKQGSVVQITNTLFALKPQPHGVGIALVMESAEQNALKPQLHGVGIALVMESAEQNVVMNRVCGIKGHSNQGTKQGSVGQITNKVFAPKPQPHGVGIAPVESAEQNPRKTKMERGCGIKGHSNQGTKQGTNTKSKPKENKNGKGLWQSFKEAAVTTSFELIAEKINAGLNYIMGKINKESELFRFIAQKMNAAWMYILGKINKEPEEKDDTKIKEHQQVKAKYSLHSNAPVIASISLVVGVLIGLFVSCMWFRKSGGGGGGWNYGSR